MRCDGTLVGYGEPWVDLTEEMFLYVHGNLTDGRIKIGVYV
jgi:hypothetical protein